MRYTEVRLGQWTLVVTADPYGPDLSSDPGRGPSAAAQSLARNAAELTRASTADDTSSMSRPSSTVNPGAQELALGREWGQ